MAIHQYSEITHWPITGSNGFGGFTFGTPVLLEGRWEYKATKFMAPTGEELVSRSIAYLPVDIDEGDYLAEGDYQGNADPTLLSNAYRIRGFERVTDLRAMDIIRKALM